jgi:hypothetical protein
MILTAIPNQPNPVISYLRVGRLLYYSLVLFILEAWFYWYKLEAAYYESDQFFTVIWFCFFLFSFSHIYLVMMDGWSRYQNYKLAKDQLYMFGFNRRIADMYIGSKCQRMAVETAAEELGYTQEVSDYYKKKGVKWFHYIPYFMVADPWFLFKKKFWSRTFLEKHYKPRFDFQKMQFDLSI